MRFDRLWLDARLATLHPSRPGLGVIERGAIGACGGRIAFAGPQRDLPANADAAERIRCDGRWITPGLIDCHTHLVFGGDRAHEFELRLAGASYEEIAAAGGGIVSTVKATRAASEDALVAGASPRLDRLIAEGVTTVEVKSGYGLDLDTEARLLRAARRLGVERPVSIVTTFLGAHALPPEANGDKDAYIATVCDDMLPAIAREGLADAVDAFCEEHRLLARADEAGFRGGSGGRAAGQAACRPAVQLRAAHDLAAEHGALSADHLEYTDADGVAAMATAGTVAVLLPGAYLRAAGNSRRRRSRCSASIACRWRSPRIAIPAHRR